MKDFKETLLFIEKNNGTIDFVSGTFADNKPLYEKNLERIKNKSTFEELVKDCSELKFVKHIKIFNTLDKNTFSLIFFNPDMYNKKSKITNVSDNLEFNIISKNHNTDRLINFIKTEDNFLKEFIGRQNKKKRHSTRLWKSTFINNEVFNIESLDKKTSYVEKSYAVVKNKIKKIVKITQDVYDEKIFGNIRIGLPNTITVWLLDNSYFAINKIFVTKKPFPGKNFKNIYEKVLYIQKIYKSFFGSEIMPEINFKISFSIEHHIGTKILYFENQKTNQNSFSEKKFLLKCSSLKEASSLISTFNGYKIKNNNIIKTISNLSLKDAFKNNNIEVIDDIFKKMEFPETSRLF